MKRIRLAALLLVGVLATLSPQWAEADGTASTTVISNKATINYKVATIDQPLIESSEAGNSTPGLGAGTATTFVVDDKVNFNIASNNSGFVTTAPGSAAVALKFTVTNTGNTVHDFALSHEVGAANTFIATDIKYYLDSGVVGSFDPLVETTPITFIDNLGVDASQVVFLVATVPLTATNGLVANYALKATAHAGGAVGLGAITTANSGSANTSASVDVVFADIDSDGAGAYDAKGVNGTNSIPTVADGRYNGIYVMWAGGSAGNPEPADEGYKVSAAALSVSKTSAVYWDPINLLVNPKAIPGAIVTYTITIANAAGATATDVSISDSLAGEAGRLSFNAQFNDGSVGTPCGALEGIFVTGGCKTNTDADGDNADFTANVLSVTGLTVPATESRVIKFQVTIQ